MFDILLMVMNIVCISLAAYEAARRWTPARALHALLALVTAALAAYTLSQLLWMIPATNHALDAALQFLALVVTATPLAYALSVRRRARDSRLVGALTPPDASALTGRGLTPQRKLAALTALLP
jgi:hypothetical protein